MGLICSTYQKSLVVVSFILENNKDQQKVNKGFLNNNSQRTMSALNKLNESVSECMHGREARERMTELAGKKQIEAPDFVLEFLF